MPWIAPAIELDQPSQRLRSAGQDGDLHIWEYPSAKHLTTIDAHSGPIYDCSWSHFNQNTLVASCSHDSTTIIWDFTDPLAPVVARTLFGHTDVVRACAFDYTGMYIVTASYDKTAKVWEVATGAELMTLEGHKGFLRCVATHPNEAVAATSGDDTVVLILSLIHI